jgi:hypothetical protein
VSGPVGTVTGCSPASSMNAAIIYQHATREADHVIADALDAGMRALREVVTKATPGPDEGNRRGLEGTR